MPFSVKGTVFSSPFSIYDERMREKMSQLKTYLSIGSCSAVQWLDKDNLAFVYADPDGKSIVRLNVETGARQRLYTTQEKIGGLQTAAGRCIFPSDAGGTENEQIFLLQDGEARNLTHDPETRHYLGGLRPDGKTLVFSCNARERQTFDIVALDAETGERRMVLQNDDNYNLPAALSPDGRCLLYNKLRGSSDNALWMVDIDAGTTRRLPADGAAAAYKAPVWTPDSRRFYYITDAGSDFFYVGCCDAVSGACETVLTFPWDVENLAVSPCGRYLAVLVNEDGYSAMYVYDLQDKTFCNIPQPPRGVYARGDSIGWAPEGLKLAFTLTSGKRPQDIWVLDMAADGLRRVTNSLPEGLSADGLTEPEKGSYRSFDGLEVPYFLYVPKGKRAENLPVMISIHGGPEGQSRPGLSSSEFLQYMVSQGIAVVAPNVRGSTGYGKAYSHLDDVEKRLDSVRDIEALVRHLTETGIADKRRIGVMGASYGGFMTLSCAARYPELWCCAVCTVGMFNLVTFLENTAPYRRPHRESEYGTLAHDREMLYRVSPVAAVDGIRGPLMIIHGQNDPRVPVSEAHQAMEYLQGRGVDARMLVYADEGHGLSKLKNKLDCFPQVIDFIKRHMAL